MCQLSVLALACPASVGQQHITFHGEAFEAQRNLKLFLIDGLVINWRRAGDHHEAIYSNPDWAT